MLIQRLISSNKYGIKCPYSMDPIGICIHNTANDASAANEISYMQSNNNEVSFHIAIDDKEAIQGIPFNRNAWAAGDGNGHGNRKYIHVEICYSKSGGAKFEAAEKRTAQEVAAILKNYGWAIDRVKKHQDFSGKYCPHRTLDTGWQRFLNMVQLELNGNPQPSGEIYRVRKSWSDAKSQVGAYVELNNAKAEANKYKGYNVYNSKGEVIYSSGGSTPPPQPQPPKQGKLKVDSFLKVDGYQWVKNRDDYAGVFGVPCKNVYAYPSNGEILVRVSPVNKNYYSWVQNYKSSNGYYDFAGDGVSIDRIQMKLRGLDGYNIRYRVHLINGGWLGWITNCNDINSNGYAGIRGRVIDAIECGIV